MTPLTTDFPNLATTLFRETSPVTSIYNCIGFAAGETHRWWWPIGYYWPPTVARDETVDAFVEAFETIGYQICETSTLEPGFEKVAIYVGPGDNPTHMARQLSSGIWTSKLGSDVDIEHGSLEALDGGSYGSAKYFLKRPSDEYPADEK